MIHLPLSRKTYSGTEPANFTPAERLEIDAFVAGEIGYINGLFPDVECGEVLPSHLQDRLRVLESIRGKVQIEE